jgi:hypothetical protein
MRNNLTLPLNAELARFLRCQADTGPDSAENAWLRKQAQIIESALQKRETEASYVMIRVPTYAWKPGDKDPDARQPVLEEGVYPIVLDTGKYVWISATYNEEKPEGVVQVGDGRDNGFSRDGCCVLSVPADWCTFYSPEEAEGIMQCIEADARLLSYAR